jgi:hypothetical protein
MEKTCSSHWDNLMIYTGMLKMKNQIRKVRHLIIGNALPTAASLIQSKVFVFNQAGSFGYINGVNENALGTAAFYKSTTDSAFFRGKTITVSAFYSGII